MARPLSSGPSVPASPGQQHQSLCWSRLSASEAIVALCSDPTGPGSLELPQPWVQGELEQGQHVSASTEGQGRRRPEETKAKQPSGGWEQAAPGGECWLGPGMGALRWKRSLADSRCRWLAPRRLISMNAITPPLLLPPSWPPGGGEAPLPFAHKLRWLSFPL